MAWRVSAWSWNVFKFFLLSQNYEMNDILEHNFQSQTSTCWLQQVYQAQLEAGLLLMRSYSGGLLVCEDLRVDPVELQDEFVHQLCVQSAVSSEEPAVLNQLLAETVCPS